MTVRSMSRLFARSMAVSAALTLIGASCNEVSPKATDSCDHVQVHYLDFTIETLFPVTREKILEQYDVSSLFRKDASGLVSLVSAATETATFDAGAVRLRVAIGESRVFYVDDSGSVESPTGTKRLDSKAFRKLREFVVAKIPWVNREIAD